MKRARIASASEFLPRFLRGASANAAAAAAANAVAVPRLPVVFSAGFDELLFETCFFA